MSRYPLVLLAFIAVTAFISCQGQQETAEEPTASEAPGEEVEEVSDVEAIRMAGEIWSNYLNGYRKWDLFPGTNEMMESRGNPHGKFGTIYANLEAKKAVLDIADVMPDGAALARENFDENGEFLKLTVMRKSGGEWFYAVYDGEGMVKAANIRSCHDCHSNYERDHIFTWSQMK